MLVIGMHVDDYKVIHDYVMLHELQMISRKFVRPEARLANT